MTTSQAKKVVVSSTIFWSVMIVLEFIGGFLVFETMSDIKYTAKLYGLAGGFLFGFTTYLVFIYINKISNISDLNESLEKLDHSNIRDNIIQKFHRSPNYRLYVRHVTNQPIPFADKIFDNGPGYQAYIRSIAERPISFISEMADCRNQLMNIQEMNKESKIEETPYGTGIQFDKILEYFSIHLMNPNLPTSEFIELINELNELTVEYTEVLTKDLDVPLYRHKHKRISKQLGKLYTEIHTRSNIIVYSDKLNFRNYESFIDHLAYTIDILERNAL